MTSITDVAQPLQRLLTTTADRLATATGCVQRHRKRSGATLAQTLVLGWLHQPDATLHQLAQMAATVGVTITPQGIARRFTEETAAFLKQVRECAVPQVLAGDPVAIPLLQRFPAVMIQDSSSVLLPASLAATWRGGGSADPATGAAAIKLPVRWELLRGTLQGPLLQDGRIHDLKAPVETLDLPTGALRLADLGYCSLETLQHLSRQGDYWLTRWQAGTVVLDAEGQPLDLLVWLRAQGDAPVDCLVRLGQSYHLPARLLALRVPPAVAAQRRRRLRAEAQRRGQPVSALRLATADWTLYLTNVPADRLTLPEALALGHARWQIELLFTLWKSQGVLDEWRSTQPWRILCELYAKLIAMVIQHWLLLTSCWSFPNRSWVKAAATIRTYAILVASALVGVADLLQVLAHLCQCLAAGCRLNRRKTHPNTYQILLDSP